MTAKVAKVDPASDQETKPPGSLGMILPRGLSIVSVFVSIWEEIYEQEECGQIILFLMKLCVVLLYNYDGIKSPKPLSFWNVHVYVCI